MVQTFNGDFKEMVKIGGDGMRWLTRITKYAELRKNLIMLQLCRK